MHPSGVGLTRRLTAVLALTAVFTVVEAVGGWLANSLALLADAGHMFGDNIALGLALVAAWSARRPPDPARTYGYQRAEILAALFNGVALIIIAFYITSEAWERFSNPPDVRWMTMLGIGTAGLIVNIIAAFLLHGSQHNLNMRGAYLHVLGDLLGSIGVLVAAACAGFGGWAVADPIASAVLSLIIVFGAIRLVLQAVHVLMEGTPSHLDATEVQAELAELSGVAGVHDLHLWTLGGNQTVLTAHLVCSHDEMPARLLRSATRLLETRFGIRHTTLQIEPPDYNIVENVEDP
ncbi:MAG: cation diffusion facilitator family transporter [Acidobacteria bacterium]|nr:cation diffusion facilitator family transporter [Acidobacteriota bacterium]NIM64215.1 cation diffusion facilitator family transporter [Acidobacteriota bacterium]NIO59213.1 cation diffusion facilitator family transporter [Acidobacteriota bacterium]NIQ30240.1 cation diffusion facilitator family transporter [Acidobacteriota bacterium]NIQ85168.1 cation diffusion facilitator family transporter [Acidobacteriota bacterium]